MKTKDGYYDVYDDLRDRVQSIINDGEKDVDEAIRQAIDDGLIYTRDIVELGLHYGVIDDSKVIDDMYEDLFDDLMSEDYHISKYRFVIYDNNLGSEVYTSDYDYETEDEARREAEAEVESYKDNIYTEETEYGWNAYVDDTLVASERNTEDEAIGMAESWVNELDITIEEEE